jgi:hypothetical protein
MKMFTCKLAQDEVTHQRLRVGSKKFVQQGRSHFDARSVCIIREHGKMARTPLAAFFNRPMKASLPWASQQASDHGRRTFQGLP